MPLPMSVTSVWVLALLRLGRVVYNNTNTLTPLWPQTGQYPCNWWSFVRLWSGLRLLKYCTLLLTINLSTLQRKSIHSRNLWQQNLSFFCELWVLRDTECKSWCPSIRVPVSPSYLLCPLITVSRASQRGGGAGTRGWPGQSAPGEAGDNDTIH